MRIAAPTSTLVTTSTAPSLPTMTSRVDPEGARRIMEMLINLYSDQRLAIVREYVSNAVDATRVAGSTAPVEVTIPSLIDPNLIITDHGTGMSTAEVEATFLAFAASTKRDTNDLIGGLGVGAKSAWTLAESFLVDTVKDGKRTVVRAARDLSHQVVLAGVPSDAPSGTTVTVPLEMGNDSSEWQRVVREVASAHPAGVVLVDGKPVASLSGGPTWIGPVSCRRVRNDSPVTITSGGTLFSSVPKVTQRVLGATRLNGALIELPVGSFDHTPSRENVIATDRTMAAIETALAAYATAYAELAARVERLCESDVAAALVLRADTLGTVGTKDHLPIPFKIGVPVGIGAWSFILTPRSRNRWERIDVDREIFAAIDGKSEISRTLVVTGVPAGRSLRAFAKFLSDQGHNVVRVIPIEAGQDHVDLQVLDRTGLDTGQRWSIGADTAGVQHFTFEEWTAALTVARAPRAATAGYECAVAAKDGDSPVTMRLTGPEIAAMNLPVWYTEGECPSYRGAAVTPASVTVYLGRRKTGPLLAAVPEAMTHAEWLMYRFTTATAEWSEAELLAGAFLTESQWSACGDVFAIADAAAKRTASDDPHTAAMARAASILATANTLSAEKVDTIRAVRECAEVRSLRGKVNALHDELLRAHPLLSNVRARTDKKTMAHFIDYVAHTPAQLSKNA